MTDSTLIAMPESSLLRRWVAGVFSRQGLPLLASVVVCVGLYTTAAVSYDNFASVQRFLRLFGAGNAYLGISAVGMTFVILAGGIDLSVGAVIACSMVLVAALVEHRHWSPLVAIPVVLLLGTAFGAGQGALIRFYTVPPFLITLGGLFLARGGALVISNQQIRITHPIYTTWLADPGIVVGHTARGTAIKLSLQAIVFLLVLVGGFVLARFTRFGRTTYAVGGNEQSATLMGLPVGVTKIGVYAISGFCAALAGVVATVDMRNGNPNFAFGQELDVIAAVVVGGTVLTGGSGSVLGTLFGFLTFAVLEQVLNFQQDLQSAWRRILVGLLLLGFILLQKFIQRRGRA